MLIKPCGICSRARGYTPCNSTKRVPRMIPQASHDHGSRKATNPMAKYADPAAVEEWITKWSEALFRCRYYGHDWQDHRARFNDLYGFFSVTDRCSRCFSLKHKELNRYGHQISKSQIEYVDGYLIKGLGRIIGDSRDVVQLAAVKSIYKLKTISMEEAANDIPRAASSRDALGIRKAS